MPEISVFVQYIRANIEQLRARMASDEGASAVEYGLIVSLIAAAIVGLVGTLGTHLKNIFTTITGAI